MSSRKSTDLDPYEVQILWYSLVRYAILILVFLACNVYLMDIFGFFARIFDFPRLAFGFIETGFITGMIWNIIPIFKSEE